MTGTVTLRYGAYGLLFGFILSRIGFADFAEVHGMFVFSDVRMLLAFAVGVALAMVGFVVFARRAQMPSRPLHPGSITGGIIFGVGWAVTGACPSIVLVQIGEGQLAATATLVGVIIGTLVYPPIHRRFFGWTMGSCSV